MQNTVSSPAKPEHAETIRIQLIAVQKTVSILIDAPFPRKVGVFRTVETVPVIIIVSAPSIVRSFYDLI
jgi:hypothetical protein